MQGYWIHLDTNKKGHRSRLPNVKPWHAATIACGWELYAWSASMCLGSMDSALVWVSDPKSGNHACEEGLNCWRQKWIESFLECVNNAWIPIFRCCMNSLFGSGNGRSSPLPSPGVSVRSRASVQTSSDGVGTGTVTRSEPLSSPGS